VIRSPGTLAGTAMDALSVTRQLEAAPSRACRTSPTMGASVSPAAAAGRTAATAAAARSSAARAASFVVESSRMMMMEPA